MQEWAGWTSQLGLSMIDPRDRETGHTLQRHARRTLSLDLDRQFERFNVGASWQAVSGSYDDPSNNNRIGGYGLLGLRGGMVLTDEVRLELKLDNLLDKQYSRALYSFDGSQYGYREEGRTWLLSLTWTPTL